MNIRNKNCSIFALICTVPTTDRQHGRCLLNWKIRKNKSFFSTLPSFPFQHFCSSFLTSIPTLFPHILSYTLSSIFALICTVPISDRQHGRCLLNWKIRKNKSFFQLFHHFRSNISVPLSSHPFQHSFLNFFPTLSSHPFPYFTLSSLPFPHFPLSLLPFPQFPLSSLPFPHFPLSSLPFPHFTLSILPFPYFTLSSLPFPHFPLSSLPFRHLYSFLTSFPTLSSFLSSFSF